ncbi:hypothetical protein MHYP_G00051600 [Metynnis hypsauchen]
MNMLEKAKCVALTGDHWTSVSNDKYLGVTAHFTGKEWNLQSFALTPYATEPSDNDPVYVVRFKTIFSTDLAKRKDTTNVTWLKIATALDPRFKDLKCLPKDERSEMWASLHNLMMTEMPTPQPSAEATETQPPKKRRMSVFLLGSSDMDTDKVGESIGQCMERYKTESKMDMEGCPLQWWSKREGAHVRLAPIAHKYLSTPATTVPCERLFSLSGHIIQKKRAALSPDNVEKRAVSVTG